MFPTLIDDVENPVETGPALILEGREIHLDPRAVEILQTSAESDLIFLLGLE